MSNEKISIRPIGVSLHAASIVVPGVARALDTLIESALKKGASDIHIERREGASFVRFRVDGLLREVDSPAPALHDSLIARLKVLARLRTDIHTLPQDGRYTFRYAGLLADIRLSIMPTYWGEKAVMRLLTKPSGRRKLYDLGFSSADCVLIERAIGQPDGLILITGPTGSGKTTTLYEILEMVAEKDISVVSLEDPIEYALGKVTQIPVHHRHNFTFSTALRALLRQDPDVVMVGEIRDAETAELAASAALTGHLVLSTLHTMDAPRTIVRLITMGVPSFVLAPSLSVVVSQRLVRKVCSVCAKPSPIPNWCLKAAELKLKKPIGLEKEMRGTGCEACGKTGFRGRSVVYEIVFVDDELRELIRSSAGYDALKNYFEKIGWRSLLGCGVDAVAGGVTTFEELFRVLHV
ncbi:MAG: GspE/PulE family protein [Patescibacteria group bacterium]